MKKIILSIVAIALIVGIAIAVFMRGPESEQKQKLQPIEDPVFVYVNLDQLITKGAFDKFITPENRSLVATVLSSHFDTTIDAEHLKSVITNIDAIGLDTYSPICCYLNDSLTDFVVVANIANAEQMDRSVALLSYILEQDGNEAIEVSRCDDMRTFEYEGICVAYNTSAFALAFGESEDVLGIAIDAVNRPQMDMSVFGASDMAVMVNVDKCIQLANAKMDDAMLELTAMYNAGEIDHDIYNAQMEAYAETEVLIDGYASYFAADSNIILSTTFDMGRMTFAYSSKGVSIKELEGISKPVSQEHLSSLSKDCLAVLRTGVDGTLLAQRVRNLVNGDMFENWGITLTNEVNMAISIACDALSTINGDVTIALDSIDGEIKSKYNYYWDEYYVEPVIDSVNAILMADVTDKYIISNVAQFAGGFINKVDATHYTLKLKNYNFSMGQDEELFHLGVNMTPQSQTPSALEAEWTKDVDGALSYLVLNVDALMASRFMQSTNKYVASQLQEEYRELYRNATELVSYVYVSSDSYESSEFVVVFDNKEINALEQINSLVLPALVRECIKSLY